MKGLVTDEKIFELYIKLDYKFPLGKYAIRGEYGGHGIGQTSVELVEPGTITQQIVPEQASEERQAIPNWIKNTAKWWSDDQIEDSDFVSGIQHLIKEKIINIPDLPEQASETAEESVPDWVRNNAGWWADGLISEDDFLNGIKFLVESGIIKV